jgi:predicted enzyme related to lactoylglutathione lyase
MTSPKLDGLLLASTNPGRLRDWYVAALAPSSSTEQDQYKMLSFGGFYLIIDSRDDVVDTNPEPGRVILNFDVDDARAVAERMSELGTKWLAEVEDRGGSLFATAIDPDGNYVQIIQLSDEHREATAEPEATS